MVAHYPTTPHDVHVNSARAFMREKLLDETDFVKSIRFLVNRIYVDQGKVVATGNAAIRLHVKENVEYVGVASSHSRAWMTDTWGKYDVKIRGKKLKTIRAKERRTDKSKFFNMKIPYSTFVMLYDLTPCKDVVYLYEILTHYCELY